MQTRHRIPTIFSIYMVDVLCCALGCVVLLWQLYHYEAQEQTIKARDSLTSLEIERDKRKQAQLAIHSFSSKVEGLKIALDASGKKNIQLTLEIEDLRGQREKQEKLAVVEKRKYDQLVKDRLFVEAMLTKERSDLKILKQKSQLTDSQLADQLKAHAETLAKMATVEKRISLLEKEMMVRQGDLMAAGKRVEDQDKLLKSADEKTRKLEKMLQTLREQNQEQLGKLSDAELRAKLLAMDLETGKKDIRALQLRYQDLLNDKNSASAKLLINAKDLDGARLALVAVNEERDNLKGKLSISMKELADARLLVGALQGDKMSLLKQNKAIQAAADNRFAGIALTGSRVVFMVDMSGSMELLDEKTSDPDKWPLVCEIVGKLMKSLPDLKEYQVILFSDKVRYPLANEGRWLTYHPEQSVKTTVAALKAIKPKNETNLHDAFEETFKFRAQGMDAIYLFSDGLPNAGPGLPPGGEKLSENEQGIHLGKYLRGKLKTWNRPINGQKVVINAVGFFFESPDVGAFLWALAREHEGSFVGMSRP